MLNKYTYLYLEDDPLSREIMHMIMTNAMGIERLTIFEDSTDFMARVKSLDRKPDVILLDIHVQPYNGFEMLDMLRDDPDHANAIIVALTASVMNEEVVKLQQSGFDGAIAKPLSVKTFPQLIEQIIQGEQVWHIA